MMLQVNHSKAPQVKMSTISPQAAFCKNAGLVVKLLLCLQLCLHLQHNF